MTDATIEKPAAARIVSALPRSKDVPITWPVEFDGKTYDAITVRRITASEVAAYAEKLTALDPTAGQLPTIDCPHEVWKALDADDADAVAEAAEGFLPQRLRLALETLRSAIESAQATGDSSQPS